MEVTTADIQTAVRQLWEATPAVKQAIPGGLAFGKVKNDARAPWAQGKATAGERELNSGRTYVQTFTLEIKVWTNKGGGDSGHAQQALNDLLSQDDAVQKLSIPHADRVMGLLAKSDQLEEDAATDNAEQFQVATGTWAIMIQATRPDKS